MSSNKEKAADFLAKRRAAAKKAEPQEARRGDSDDKGPAGNASEEDQKRVASRTGPALANLLRSG